MFPLVSKSQHLFSFLLAILIPPFKGLFCPAPLKPHPHFFFPSLKHHSRVPPFTRLFPHACMLSSFSPETGSLCSRPFIDLLFYKSQDNPVRQVSEPRLRDEDTGAPGQVSRPSRRTSVQFSVGTYKPFGAPEVTEVSPPCPLGLRLERSHRAKVRSSAPPLPLSPRLLV